SAMIDKLIDLSAVSFVLYDGVSKQNFIFNDWVPTSISALSLHDALPIWGRDGRGGGERSGGRRRSAGRRDVLQSAVPRDEERGGAVLGRGAAAQLLARGGVQLEAGQGEPGTGGAERRARDPGQPGVQRRAPLQRLGPAPRIEREPAYPRVGPAQRAQ